MISRQMQSLLKRLVAQFPAVLVTGARQVGKSTLLQHIGEGYQYITLMTQCCWSWLNKNLACFF